jgi:hypothetical protein
MNLMCQKRRWARLFHWQHTILQLCHVTAPRVLIWDYLPTCVSYSEYFRCRLIISSVQQVSKVSNLLLHAVSQTKLRNRTFATQYASWSFCTNVSFHDFKQSGFVVASTNDCDTFFWDNRRLKGIVNMLRNALQNYLMLRPCHGSRG